MERNLVELRGCLASIQRMIERADLLVSEYDALVRNARNPAPVESLKYQIRFSEVRSLDQLCKDTLARSLPDHPELAANWYVHGDKGPDGPEDIRDDLYRKKSVMEHAIDLAQLMIPSSSGAARLTAGLPQSYDKLAGCMELFFKDSARSCQDYSRNVFIMTRFERNNRVLDGLDKTIREVLLARTLIGHRADDRCYPNDRNLWDNVCTYMFGCKYGIAVLEDIIAAEFNPNVALEYGFMRALGKPTLLLKERRFKPRADILGTVWHEFDILDLERSVSTAIEKWIDDIES